MLTACADTTTRIADGVSCADVVNFDGHTYLGTTLRTHPPYNQEGVIPMSHLHKIGVAVRPPCRDSNHPDDNPTLRSVQVAQIDEVSPKIAIAALPRGNVYLRRGAAVPPVLTSSHWVHWNTSG
jgi:hypothetical protein